MKIRHIAGPKNGTTEHVLSPIGNTLIAAGFAEEIRLPRRGSAGWAEARLEQSAVAGSPDAHDVAPPFFKEAQWSVKDKESLNGVVMVVKRIASEVIFYAEPPADAPTEIVVRFNALKGLSNAPVIDVLGDAKRKQFARECVEKHARRW